MASGISPALPLVVDPTDGPYRLTKSINEAVEQNFKNLILTNPGERIMDPEFGVGIRRYLFELAESDVQDTIRFRIRQQVDKYLPMVQVFQINFGEGSNNPADRITIEESGALYIQIAYKINALNISNILTIPIE